MLNFFLKCAQEGNGSIRLLAKGASDGDLTDIQLDEKMTVCPSCDYDPKATCECKICQASCTSRSFNPHAQDITERANKLQKRLAKRQGATSKRQQRFLMVNPDSDLSRALNGATPTALHALPSFAQAAIGMNGGRMMSTGFSGSALHYEQTGRGPSALFEPAMGGPYSGMPRSVIHANRRVGGLIAQAGTGDFQVNLPLRSTSSENQQSLLASAQQNYSAAYASASSSAENSGSDTRASLNAAASEVALANTVAVRTASFSKLGKCVLSFVNSSTNVPSPAKKSKCDVVADGIKIVKRILLDESAPSHQPIKNVVDMALLETADDNAGEVASAALSEVFEAAALDPVTPGKYGERDP